VETTELCRELTGNEVPIGGTTQTRPGDVPLYISDCARLFERTDWRPSRTPREILADIQAWIKDNEPALEAALV
jgi:CDP-paratose 2-epimerase